MLIALALLPALALAQPRLDDGLRGDPAALAAEPATEPARAKRVLELGELVVASPNNARLHMELALAYFERGAQEDARRVSLHGRRAVELDPALAGPLATALAARRSGLWSGTVSAQMQQMDGQIEATLPAPGESPERTAERQIQVGLARRVAQVPVRDEPVSYKQRLQDLGIAFETAGKDGESDRSRERARELSTATTREDEWARLVDQRLAVAVERFDRGRAKPATGPTDPDAVPDPMLVKNEAFLDYIKGDVRGSLDKLLRAAAASETLVQGTVGAMVTPPRTLDPTTPPRDATPGRDQPAAATTPDRTQPAQPASPTPKRAQPVTPTTPGREQSGAPAPTTPAPTTPGRQQPGAGDPQVPPVQMRSLGQAALEAAEAIKDPDLPPADVSRKVREVATTGIAGEPLLIDLDRDGKPGLRGELFPRGELDPARAVRFDLDGDGFAEQVEWVVPSADGLLAIDREGDGLVHDGRQLFGGDARFASGFAQLALLDIDRDGQVSGRELAGVLVWRDDGDGRCRPGEVRTAADCGITAIALPSRDDPMRSWCRTGGTRLRIWEWHPDVRVER